MRHHVLILLLGVFALCAISVPQTEDGDRPAALTEQVLVRIAPTTASCAGAPFPEECADAAQAAGALNTALERYGISALGEIVAIVAYLLFESGNFKYNKNHFPGRPGQGTRSMAMPPVVKCYAESVAGAGAVAEAEAAGGDAGLDAVLKLANCNDEKSFGSAPWLLSTRCREPIRSALARGGLDGWHNFLTMCVNTTVTTERDTLWRTTKQIMSEGA